MVRFRTLLLLALFSLSCFAQTNVRWEAIQFLLGNWTAKGDGATGPAAGDYSFKPELNNQIVVRHSFAEYNKVDAARHDDLLVIYADAPGQPMHAIYFDSEGHVIHYTVKTASLNTVVFESDPAQPGPKYRLSYDGGGKRLNGKFEVADPEKTEYKTYLAWTSLPK